MSHGVDGEESHHSSVIEFSMQGVARWDAMQVILLTDADVDGAHIRTLLLTFLFRYARDLFDKGYIFVGVPPLYKLEVGRSSQYLYSDAELAARTQGLSQGSYTIQRFKVIPLQ